jgi:hypothetical protein
MIAGEATATYATARRTVGSKTHQTAPPIIPTLQVYIHVPVFE